MKRSAVLMKRSVVLIRIRILVLIWMAASLAPAVGCAALSARGSEEAEIRISDTLVGGNPEISPPLLKVRPGQRVVWSNNTNYQIQIQFEPDQAGAISERPSFIHPLSVAGGKFEEAGSYTYTLVFSSSKNFGRVTGTIVVESPDPPREKTAPAPPEEAPAEPQII